MKPTLSVLNHQLLSLPGFPGVVVYTGLGVGRKTVGERQLVVSLCVAGRVGHVFCGGG